MLAAGMSAVDEPIIDVVESITNDLLYQPALFNRTNSLSTIRPDNETVQSLPVESQRVLIALYTITTFLAVTGNLLVIVLFVVSRRARTDLRTFLANLAAADLLMAVFCMPFTFTYTMHNEWIFGPFMCTLVLFVQTISVTASVGTSTVIAIDRYLVVAHPLRSRGNTRCRARYAIAAIWSVAFALCSVQLFVGRMVVVGEGNVVVIECIEQWPEPKATWRTAYSFFVLTHTYVAPLIIIGITYTLIARKLWTRRTPGNADEARDYNQLQSKRKVIKMLVIVVALFAICWLPLHVFALFMDFHPHMNNEGQTEASSIGAAVYTSVHWLAMSNSFVNSIVYGFLNDSFRSDVRWLLSKIFFCCPQCRALQQPIKPEGFQSECYPVHVQGAAGGSSPYTSVHRSMKADGDFGGRSRSSQIGLNQSPYGSRRQQNRSGRNSGLSLDNISVNSHRTGRNSDLSLDNVSSNSHRIKSSKSRSRENLKENDTQMNGRATGNNHLMIPVERNSWAVATS